jgi:hypothetical protein
MEETISKADFVAALRAGRAEWEALLAEIPAEWMTRPGAAGDWTPKDVIAHVAWHEREMAGVLEQRAMVGSELWQIGLDERNQAIYEQNRDRPLDELLAEEAALYARMLAGVAALEDDDLNDPGRYREMPGERRPHQVFVGNMHGHYHEHLPELRAWLRRQLGEPG